MKALTTLLLMAFITMSGIAQKKLIKGNVSDESGMPLPGVNILIKGATTGTQSDFDGKYELQTNVGDVLVFTYVGLKTVEQTVGTSNIIDVILEEDAAMLEEVVVAGYGYSRVSYKPTKAQLKRQKQKAYHNDITQTLQGKVAGVQIRGVATTSKNQPLYIVDGVPIHSYYNSIIQNIDSQDIEHINVGSSIWMKMFENSLLILGACQILISLYKRIQTCIQCFLVRCSLLRLNRSRHS